MTRGASILNDVTGFGEEMLQVAASSQCGCVVMDPDTTAGPDIQDYDIDFGLTNKGTATVLWDAESSTANPIEDLQGWVNQCIQNGYRLF